jgi:small subunit ribosomal protein S8
MSIDLMSNMLSSIKNASMAGRRHIEIPYSKECEAVAKVMKESGYVEEVKSFKLKGKAYKMLRIDLAYDENDLPAINSIERVSKPGRRVYKGSSDIGKVMGGYGLMIVSTSRGITSGEEARRKKLGGELVCKIW